MSVKSNVFLVCACHFRFSSHWFMFCVSLSTIISCTKATPIKNEWNFLTFFFRLSKIFLHQLKIIKIYRQKSVFLRYKTLTRLMWWNFSSLWFFVSFYFAIMIQKHVFLVHVVFCSKKIQKIDQKLGKNRERQEYRQDMR